MGNMRKNKLQEGAWALTNRQAFTRILAANANIQHHLAIILEAQAREMVKVGAWTHAQVRSSTYELHEAQFKDALRIHERMVEVIDGITKVETGLARHMKMALHTDSDGESSSDGLLGKLLDA